MKNMLRECRLPVVTGALSVQNNDGMLGIQFSNYLAQNNDWNKAIYKLFENPKTLYKNMNPI